MRTEPFSTEHPEGPGFHRAHSGKTRLGPPVLSNPLKTNVIQGKLRSREGLEVS